MIRMCIARNKFPWLSFKNVCLFVVVACLLLSTAEFFGFGVHLLLLLALPLPSFKSAHILMPYRLHMQIIYHKMFVLFDKDKLILCCCFFRRLFFNLTSDSMMISVSCTTLLNSKRRTAHRVPHTYTHTHVQILSHHYMTCNICCGSKQHRFIGCFVFASGKFCFIVVIKFLRNSLLLCERASLSLSVYFI